MTVTYLKDGKRYVIRNVNIILLILAILMKPIIYGFSRIIRRGKRYIK
jgi:hypothetical protein